MMNEETKEGICVDGRKQEKDRMSDEQKANIENKFNEVA